MSVGAGHDLAKAHDALIRLARSDARVLAEPAVEVVNLKLVDGGTQIELHAWGKTGDYGGIMSSLVAKAPSAFAEAGVKGPDKSVIFVERK